MSWLDDLGEYLFGNDYEEGYSEGYPDGYTDGRKDEAEARDSDNYDSSWDDDYWHGAE